jgi:hypothetical protein
VDGLATQVRVEFLRYYWILSYTPKADGQEGSGV